MDILKKLKQNGQIDDYHITLQYYTKETDIFIVAELIIYQQQMPHKVQGVAYGLVKNIAQVYAEAIKNAYSLTQLKDANQTRQNYTRPKTVPPEVY